jgi:hypothetical protein
MNNINTTLQDWFFEPGCAYKAIQDAFVTYRNVGRIVKIDKDTIFTVLEPARPLRLDDSKFQTHFEIPIWIRGERRMLVYSLSIFSESLPEYFEKIETAQ